MIIYGRPAGFTQLATGILVSASFIQEKAVAAHSSPLAWEVPWAEEPGGLQSVGLQRVRHY